LIAVAAVAAVIDDAGADLAPVARVVSIGALLAAGVGVIGAVPAAGPITAALLGGAYLLARAGDATLDPLLVPVAIALFVVAELVAWSAEEREARRPGVRVGVRAQRLVQAAAFGGAAALGVTAIATAPVPNDLAVAAVGVAALALTAGVVATLARHRSADE
jgi:hypothetical protein